MEGSSLISYQVFNLDSASTSLRIFLEKCTRGGREGLKKKKKKRKEKEKGKKISNLFLTKSLPFILSRKKVFLGLDPPP